MSTEEAWPFGGLYVGISSVSMYPVKKIDSDSFDRYETAKAPARL